MDNTNKQFFDMVGEFHKAFGHPTSTVFDDYFCSFNRDAIEFRLALNKEELEELKSAYNNLYFNCNLFERKETAESYNMIVYYYKEVIDACCDLIYVLNGQLHYIGYNQYSENDLIKLFSFEIDVKKLASDYSQFNFTEFNVHNIATKFYSTLLINTLDKVYKFMEENKSYTKHVVVSTLYMINVIKQLAKCMGFNILDCFKIVHKSNMTKLCYSEEEASLTINKYKKLFLETNDPKYKFPTSKIVDLKKNIWMVSNKDPSTGSECAKVLKSINFKEPDFSKIISISTI